MPPTGPSEPWSAALHLSPGSAFYLSPIGTTGRHRHHALQACVGGKSPFRLRLDPRDSWGVFDAAIVDAEVPHQFDGGGKLMAMLYLEPEIGTGQLRLACTASGIARLEDERLGPFRREMSVVEADGFPPEAVRDLHRRLLEILGRERSPRRPLDPRIGHLIGLMRSRPADPWTLEEAAAVLTLSPCRARHLFASELGTTLRRFRRWIRLEAALHTLVDRGSLTAAAHYAGFADSAHLSRAFREMFGITPSSATGVARILVDTGPLFV